MISEPGLYNMDCMVALKEYPDNYFDLAIVDPPYGDAGGGFSGKERFGERFDRYRGTASTAKAMGGYDTLRAASEKGRVHRTGGTWAEKFGKKT